MSVLLCGLLVFVFAFLIHLVIWRVHLPENQIMSLLWIFSTSTAIGAFVLLNFHEYIRWNILPERNIFEILQFLFLSIALAATYIVSYPAIEADSPTLLIIKAVLDAGPQGLEKGRLEQIMNNDLLVAPRIRDLLSGNMAYLADGKYKLTPKGFVMAYIFLSYRKLIRGSIGG